MSLPRTQFSLARDAHIFRRWLRISTRMVVHQEDRRGIDPDSLKKAIR